MTDKFKHIADLFNQSIADAQSAQSLPVEKPWIQKTEDEKMTALLAYCLRSRVFVRSDPPFDREWFIRVHRDTEATMDDLKAVLEDCEEYMKELIEKGAFRYRDVRRHIIYRLKKYLAWKAVQARKKQPEIRRPAPVIELPKEQMCTRCRTYKPRDLFTLDGICIDCAEIECAGCHGLFKLKDLTQKGIRFFCKTCYEKL